MECDAMSQSKTVIVDYGLGNLRSVAAAITEVGGTPEVTSDPSTIERGERIILPGVGAFGVAARYLETSGIGRAVVAASGRGTPVLGICLGMQLLFEKGNEFGWSNGLGLIPGEVLPIVGSVESEDLPDTHIGWRELTISPSHVQHPLFAEVAAGDSFYFVHSFSAHAVEDDNILASVNYGAHSIVVAAGNNNVVGVQFHPEKSGRPGLRILENFIKE